MTQDNYIELPSLESFQKVSEVAETARYSGIREVLTSWGNWAREQPNNGFPRKSPGMGQNPATGGMQTCSDEEGLIVDKAVLALKAQSDDHYKAIFSKYVIGVTNKRGADYIGIPVRRYYELVAAGEMALSVALLVATSVFEV